LRKELLSLALNYYLGFIKQRADDPNVRKDLADAHIRAGEIYQETFTGPDENVGSKRGMELRLRGIALYEELVREKPADQELRVALAGGLLGPMSILWEDGAYEAGLERTGRVIRLWEQLLAEDPSNVNFERMLGDAYSFRALLKRDIIDREGQAADIRRAAEIFKEILKRAPDDEATLSELAAAYRRSDRLDDLLEALRISRQLVKSGTQQTAGRAMPLLKRNAVLRYESVLLTNALGNAASKYIYDLGQPGKAEPLCLESVELERELMRQSPESNNAIFEFVLHSGNLGEAHFLQGKTQPAVRTLKETVSYMEELKRRNYSQGVQDDPAWLRYILGCLECETGDLKGGLERCETARRVEEGLLAQNKVRGEENPAYVAHHLTMREAIARFRFLAGTSNREERLAQQRQILAERKALHEREPKVPQYEREIGASAAVLAGLLLETGRADEALAIVDDVLPALEKLVRDDQPDSSQPSQIDPRNYLIRRVLAELLAHKAEALARTGKSADAGQAIRPAIEITEDLCKQEPCYLDDLAHHLTLASTLPGGAGVSNAADRAVKALRDYIAAGFDNPYKLRHDPRLEPLRQRDDFQKLVRELETKVKEAKQP
jgi:tetratricopeptide (TPR) repeat protein